MSGGPLLVATTPHYNTPPELVAAALDSLPDWACSFDYEAPLHRFDESSPYMDERDLRARGLEHARRRGARYWLQLDADEILWNGDELEELLRHELPAVPLPRLEPDGAWTLCPYKLVRLPCELVAGCDHFRFNDGPTVYRLSGYPVELPDRLLRGGPYIEHRHTAPPDAWRLGATELESRARYPDAVQFRPSSLLRKAATMGEPVSNVPTLGDDERSVDDKRPYYCPECGARYDTAGICEGYVEAGHPAAKVEKVKGESGGESSASKSSSSKSSSSKSSA